MARYDEQHKQATRARILETAGRRLKTDGIDGSGVSTLMRDAGLTNGAFYAHFASKADLVAEVVATQLRAQLERIEGLAPGREGVAQLVDAYLSPAHRDDVAGGCPLAALGDEVARDEATRAASTAGVLAIADALGARLGGAPRARVLAAYAAMVGTLQLARSLTDADLSDEVLAEGRRTVGSLLGLS